MNIISHNSSKKDIENYYLAKSFTESELANSIDGHVFIVTPYNKEKIIKHVVSDKHKITKALIFYETGSDPMMNTKQGHWCCMFFRYPNIYFFDSLGLFPDDQLNKIPMSYRTKSNQVERRLGKIFYALTQKGYKIHYNDKKYQEEKNDVATCGRYCRLFLTECIDDNVDPYIKMKRILKFYKLKNEKFYDNAIVRYDETTYGG